MELCMLCMLKQSWWFFYLSIASPDVPTTQNQRKGNMNSYEVAAFSILSRARNWIWIFKQMPLRISIPHGVPTTRWEWRWAAVFACLRRGSFLLWMQVSIAPLSSGPYKLDVSRCAFWNGRDQAGLLAVVFCHRSARGLLHAKNEWAEKLCTRKSHNRI